MRAAVIFGPGASSKDVERFQRNSEIRWIAGVPRDHEEADAILIFGGDGTIHRHLAQLVQLRIPILVVPCGSGNDFARALNLRNVRDSLAAWRRFTSSIGHPRTIDLGVIRPLATEPDGSNESAHHYFCCVGGVGLDGEIARRANRLPRWLRAHGGYILSLVPALLKFAPIPMKISASPAEDPNQFANQKAQSVVVAVFANAPAFGGGMRIAPGAQLDDGILDVCIVPEMSRLKLFCLFPTIYFGGHLSVPGVQFFRTKLVRLDTETTLDVYADGEYVCQTPVEVSVAPAALHVIAP